MKKSVFILCALLAFLVFGCPGTSDAIKDAVNQSSLKVGETSLVFTEAGGSQLVAVSGDADWFAVSDQSWCSVSPNSGSGNAAITVVVQQNNAVVQRSAKITVSAADNSLSREIVITQAAGQSTGPVTDSYGNSIDASPVTLDFQTGGGSKTIQITANVTWQIVSDQSWCSVSVGSGSGNATVNVSAAANSGDADRIAILTVSNTEYELNQYVTVTQQGSGIVSVAVTGVTLSQTTASLTTSAMMTLTATVLPANASNKTVTWSSSNPSVATVDNGVVTAVGVGTATIIVTTQNGSKTAACSVTVTGVALTGVTLNKTTLSLLKAGATETLIANVLPATATNKTVTWSSSNASVATVNAGGTVTATGVGTATITATTQEGSKTATCSVTVAGVAQVRFYNSFSNTYQTDRTMRVRNSSGTEVYAQWSIVNGGTSAYYEVPAGVYTILDVYWSYTTGSGWDTYTSYTFVAGNKYTWRRVINGSSVSNTVVIDGTF